MKKGCAWNLFSTWRSFTSWEIHIKFSEIFAISILGKEELALQILTQKLDTTLSHFP